MIARITIATLAGLVMGLFCWQGGVLVLGNDYTTAQITYILLHRSIMGFVIGISALQMDWRAHGLLLGLITGLTFSLYELITKDFFGYQMWVIIALVPIGAIYGLMIEFITTKICRQPQKA